MYAVVSSGGKQYRVEPGTTLTMERIGAEAGAPFTFDRVLLIGDGDQVTVGSPVVSGATVSATVVGEELGPKLVIFKFKQKVKYRRRTGHRQHLVRVRIDAINADGASKRTRTEKADTAEKAEKAEGGPKGEKAARTQKADTATKAGKAPAKRAPRTKAASGQTATDTQPKATRKPRTTKATTTAEKPAEE